MPSPLVGSALTVIAVPVGRVLATVRIRSSPSLMIVSPVYVLLPAAHAIARTPKPVFVKEPGPEIFVPV